MDKSLFPALLVVLICGPLVVSASPRDWEVEWLDKDGDCQNTRTEVLLRDNIGLIQWADPMACKIQDGRWRSLGLDVELDYANARVALLVPPGNAEVHGAGDWSREQWRTFMNDMDNLIVLDPVSRRERNGYGPERWIPLEKHWCEYARGWETIKQRYSLEMGKQEREALARMKQECGAPGAQDAP